MLEQFKEQIRAGKPLRIRGAGSKDFYGLALNGEVLDTRGHKGIVAYEPTELYVTAKCGTPLAEVEAALAAKGQCLAFEPPRFSPDSTIGGVVASGLSGPRRSSAGALRDFVLGVKLIDGSARELTFGGQVMKNVAGYDVSRVLAGSMGVLGAICEVSLKVLPVPAATATLRFEMDQASALQRLNEGAGRPLPLHASAWWQGLLVLRLSGAAAAVRAAARSLGGALLPPELAGTFWAGLRDQGDEYFVHARATLDAGATLWRLSLPPTAPPLALDGDSLIEWGGAQRWLCTRVPAGQVRDAAAAAGGHATLFMGHVRSVGVFAPLKSPLDRIHRELKRAFDPDGVFNPGRLYPELCP
jgi:glycolate oxidase FAD binding subunit